MSIPRTLAMSREGLRDFSMIATARVRDYVVPVTFARVITLAGSVIYFGLFLKMPYSFLPHCPQCVAAASLLAPQDAQTAGCSVLRALPANASVSASA